MLRALLNEEVVGRDAATRRMLRKSANFPTGKSRADHVAIMVAMIGVVLPMRDPSTAADVKRPCFPSSWHARSTAELWYVLGAAEWWGMMA